MKRMKASHPAKCDKRQNIEAKNCLIDSNPLGMPPVNCAGGYGPWTRCNEEYTKYRYYEHTVEARFGGADCPAAHGHLEAYRCGAPERDCEMEHSQRLVSHMVAWVVFTFTYFNI